MVGDEIYVHVFVRFKRMPIFGQSYEIIWLSTYSAIIITTIDDYRFQRKMILEHGTLLLTEIQLIKQKL